MLGEGVLHYCKSYAITLRLGLAAYMTSDAYILVPYIYQNYVLRLDQKNSRKSTKSKNKKHMSTYPTSSEKEKQVCLRKKNNFREEKIMEKCV